MRQIVWVRMRERERREEDGRERKITEENTDSRLKKEIIQTE